MAELVGAHDGSSVGPRKPMTARLKGEPIRVFTLVSDTLFQSKLGHGLKVAFKGKALAPDGRAGIQATRMSGGASDVAAAAAEAALRSVGEGAANAAGDNPLGAAIRGGTSTAAAKGRNLDNSSSGYKTRRNARFFIYVVGR